MKNKPILELCIIFLLLIPASAFALSEETPSFSRVVGDSQTKMLRQFQRNETEGEK